MKGKVRSSKLKLGVPTFFFLCALFFFVGFFVSPLLFQDLGDVGPRSRILQESVKKAYEPLEHGESGEPFLNSIPFQFDPVLFADFKLETTSGLLSKLHSCGSMPTNN
ncbi:putative prolyl 4-hydroxylase 9 [Glycine max]|nr:putative prolyl 4-hydroxylase 9 [Glycine max]